MENIYKLRFGNYVKIGTDIWMFNQGFNGLVCIGELDGRIKKIYKEPKSSVDSRFLYSSIVYHDGKIVLVPMFASTITVFDVEKEQFESFPLDIDRYSYGSVRSIGCYQREEKLYILPANMFAIIKFNISNCNIEYIEISVDSKMKDNKEIIFRNQYEVVENKIYSPFVSTRGIAVYDFDTDSFEVILKEEIKNCSTISYSNGVFYLGSFDEKKLYVWEKGNSDVKIILLEFETMSNKIFNASWIQSNKLVLFPYHADVLLIYDINKKDISKVKIEVDLSENITCYFADKTNYTASFSGEQEIEKFVYINGEIQMEPIFLYDEIYNNQKISNYLVKQGLFKMVMEKKYSLKEYLSVISNL